MNFEDKLFDKKAIFFENLCCNDRDRISDASKSLMKIAKSAIKINKPSIAEDVFRVFDAGVNYAFLKNHNKTAIMLSGFANDSLWDLLKLRDLELERSFYGDQCFQAVPSACSEGNLLKQSLAGFSGSNPPAVDVVNKIFGGIDHRHSNKYQFSHEGKI